MAGADMSAVTKLAQDTKEGELGVVCRDRVVPTVLFSWSWEGTSSFEAPVTVRLGSEREL